MQILNERRHLSRWPLCTWGHTQCRLLELGAVWGQQAHKSLLWQFQQSPQLLGQTSVLVLWLGVCLAVGSGSSQLISLCSCPVSKIRELSSVKSNSGKKKPWQFLTWSVYCTTTQLVTPTPEWAGARAGAEIHGNEGAAPHDGLVVKSVAFDIVASVTFVQPLEGTARQELRFRYNSKPILVQLFSVCPRKWCKSQHAEVSLLSSCQLSAGCAVGAFLLCSFITVVHVTLFVSFSPQPLQPRSKHATLMDTTYLGHKSPFPEVSELGVWVTIPHFVKPHWRATCSPSSQPCKVISAI